MAFIAKKDYCGLERANLSVAASDTDAKTGSIVQASDDQGSFVASTYVDGGMAPTNSYDLKGAVAFTGTDVVKLGKVKTIDTKKYMLTDVNVATSNKGAPTLDAACALVESSATDEYYYTVPAFTVPKTHHATMLFTEATLAGDGCYLQSSSYKIGAKADIARDELGVEISSGLHEGQITVDLTINQTGTTVPTVTATNGFTISSPLTRSNPKSDYPTWTVTLVKPLTKVAASAS